MSDIAIMWQHKIWFILFVINGIPYNQCILKYMSVYVYSVTWSSILYMDFEIIIGKHLSTQFFLYNLTVCTVCAISLESYSKIDGMGFMTIILSLSLTIYDTINVKSQNVTM